MEQKSNGKIFCFKNKFLNFLETKKFSTESFLIFRELQPLLSYKRVSYEKTRLRLLLYILTWINEIIVIGKTVWDLYTDSHRFQVIGLFLYPLKAFMEKDQRHLMD